MEDERSVASVASVESIQGPGGTLHLLIIKHPHDLAAYKNSCRGPRDSGIRG